MSTLFLTGSTGALGSAIRENYLAEGWSVAGFSHKDDGFTHERYRFWAMDATDEASVEQAFKNAARDLGAPRVTVATVGGVKSWKPIAETPIEDFRFLFELNLLSFFISAKQALH